MECLPVATPPEKLPVFTSRPDGSGIVVCIRLITFMSCACVARAAACCALSWPSAEAATPRDSVSKKSDCGSRPCLALCFSSCSAHGQVNRI